MRPNVGWLGAKKKRISDAEMRVLCWMSGYTRPNRMYHQRRLGVAPILEKMLEPLFRWLRHVWRQHVEAQVRKVDQMEE